MNTNEIMRRYVGTVYDKILRPYLPYKVAVYNGIPAIGSVRLLDSKYEFPEYKAANIAALRKLTHAGDDVTVIGGGIGVTAVVAAQQVTSDGSVTIYEASIDEVRKIRRTLNLNKVSSNCKVNHAVVGDLFDKGGKLGNPKQISPSELDNCDALEMDCEGAELGILDELVVRPGVIIVETHPKFGSPTPEVADKLGKMGYDIREKTVDPEDGHIIGATIGN